MSLKERKELIDECNWYEGKQFPKIWDGQKLASALFCMVPDQIYSRFTPEELSIVIKIKD